MKKKLTANLGLKILALLFSVIIWLIVVNINDPLMTQTYNNISVEILNTDSVTSEGKTYEILDNSNAVNVTITAKRSVMQELSKDNIHAVADMEELTFMDTIGIKVYSDKYNDRLENVRTNIENVKVRIETMKRGQFVIELSTSGEPAKGCLIGNIKSDQNIVRVSGPESAIKQIHHAEAVVDVSGMTADISTIVDIKLYNENGGIITNKNITKNIDSVNVGVEILGIKTIPIEYAAMGLPMDGFALTGVIDSNPAHISIAGKKSVLDSIKKIEIPETALNVTGQSSNMTTNVDISSYLPDNIILADPEFNGKATVVVHIEKEVSKTAIVNKRNIKILNLPVGMKATIEDFDEPRSIYIAGLLDVLNTIDLNAVVGTIDINQFMLDLSMETLNEGVYEIQLVLDIPKTAKPKEVIYVKINVTAEEE